MKARVELRHTTLVSVMAQRCHPRGARCEWKTLVTKRRRARSFTVTLKPRLIPGRYRVRAIARNAEGRSRPRSDGLLIP